MKVNPLCKNINHMFCLISVYVDMGLASNAPVTLTVVTNVTDSNTRSFSIKITQIDCLSFSRGISKFSFYIISNVSLFYIVKYKLYSTKLLISTAMGNITLSII